MLRSILLRSRFYTPTHEWISTKNGIATIGITPFAAKALGDIVYIELPSSTLTKGESMGAVESVKAASDLYAPISGSVLEVNKDLEESPASINEDAFGKGNSLIG